LAAPALRSSPAARNATSFIDETGGLHLTSERLFGVGLLVVRDIGTLTNALTNLCLNSNSRWMEHRKQLRREAYRLRTIDKVGMGELFDTHFDRLLSRTRHTEFKFAAIRKDNVDECLAFLNVFFNAASDTEFHALLVERDEEALASYSGRSWPTYVQSVRRVLDRRLQAPSFVCCDWQSQPGCDDLSLEQTLAGIGHVTGALRISSDTSPFIQLTDLLLGAVSFDWRYSRGYLPPSKSSEAKRDVVRFIKAHLRLPHQTPFLPDGKRYFARRTPLSFTVWQSSPEYLKMPKARGMHRGLTR
jgi:hypothetical protein